MHCVVVLQKHLEESLLKIHKRRREAVWRGVEGLIVGGKLWLSALGRSMPGQTSDKHRIKAANRLLGSASIQASLPLFYRALAQRLLRHTHSPIVAVDWTGCGAQHYALSAQLCCDGRSLPLYHQVYSKRHVGNHQLHLKFLRELATVLPSHCKPIIITDAGFRTKWFDAVAAFGWDFIGRMRDTTRVFTPQGWVPIKSLYYLATSKPRDFGLLTLTRYKPRGYRLVLSKRPQIKGRKRKSRNGKIGRKRIDLWSSAAAREPWLLATSLSSNAKFVLRAYGMRMQIEQAFRDTKNHRHGWGFHHARSASPKRLAVLLLISSLATVAVELVGRAVCLCCQQRQFQANTTTHRRVLSFFVLGRHALRRSMSLPRTSLLQALNEIAATLALNGWFSLRL